MPEFISFDNAPEGKSFLDNFADIGSIVLAKQEAMRKEQEAKVDKEQERKVDMYKQLINSKLVELAADGSDGALFSYGGMNFKRPTEKADYGDMKTMLEVEKLRQDLSGVIPPGKALDTAIKLASENPQWYAWSDEQRKKAVQANYSVMRSLGSPEDSGNGESVDSVGLMELYTNDKAAYEQFVTKHKDNPSVQAVVSAIGKMSPSQQAQNTTAPAGNKMTPAEAAAAFRSDTNKFIGGIPENMFNKPAGFVAGAAGDMANAVSGFATGNPSGAVSQDKINSMKQTGADVFGPIAMLASAPVIERGMNAAGNAMAPGYMATNPWAISRNPVVSMGSKMLRAAPAVGNLTRAYALGQLVGTGAGIAQNAMFPQATPFVAHPFAYMTNKQYRDDPIGYISQYGR